MHTSAQPPAMPAPEAVIKVRAFLTMKAVSCSTGAGPDAQHGLLLAVRDTSQLFPDGLVASWLGTDATQFLTQHQADLVPGRCLDLEIYHLIPANQKLRARIKTCQLAPLPPSWIAHDQKARSVSPHNNPETHHA